MKNTGVVRKLDPLGRIVLPKELRDNLDLEDAALEIFVDGEDIVLRKYEASCIFCGEASNVIEYKGKKICKKCLKELKK